MGMNGCLYSANIFYFFVYVNDIFCVYLGAV